MDVRVKLIRGYIQDGKAAKAATGQEALVSAAASFAGVSTQLLRQLPLQTLFPKAEVDADLEDTEMIDADSGKRSRLSALLSCTRTLSFISCPCAGVVLHCSFASDLMLIHMLIWILEIPCAAHSKPV